MQTCAWTRLYSADLTVQYFIEVSEMSTAFGSSASFDGRISVYLSGTTSLPAPTSQRRLYKPGLANQSHGLVQGWGWDPKWVNQSE